MRFAVADPRRAALQQTVGGFPKARPRVAGQIDEKVPPPCETRGRRGSDSVVASLPVPIIGISSRDSGQEVIDDEVGHRAAEIFAGIFIGAEMLARVDPAQACLLFNGR